MRNSFNLELRNEPEEANDVLLLPGRVAGGGQALLRGPGAP